MPRPLVRLSRHLGNRRGRRAHRWRRTHRRSAAHGRALPRGRRSAHACSGLLGVLLSVCWGVV